MSGEGGTNIFIHPAHTLTAEAGPAGRVWGAPLCPQTETHAQAVKQIACLSRLNVQATEKPAARPVAPLPPVHCLHSAGASSLSLPAPHHYRPARRKSSAHLIAAQILPPLTMPAPANSFAQCLHSLPASPLCRLSPLPRLSPCQRLKTRPATMLPNASKFPKLSL